MATPPRPPAIPSPKRPQAAKTTARTTRSARGTDPDPARLASDLRVVIGGLMRRLRAEHRFPLTQGAVLGRLDRGGARTVSELEADGLVARRPDPADGRRALVALTDQGSAALNADRRQREGWLALAIAEELSGGERATLAEAAELLRRLAES